MFQFNHEKETEIKSLTPGGWGGGEIRQNFFCISKKGAILFFKQFVVIVRISIYLQPK